MMTYGDGVADIDLGRLVAFHKAHGKIATVTAVRPPGRFGEMRIAGDAVSEFNEKPQVTEGYINGGFFVCRRELLDWIEPGDELVEETFSRLIPRGEVVAYPYEGFFGPMDTIKDRQRLEALHESGRAPWRMVGLNADREPSSA
jgi:glucose-1-phosphate cytidylyltransferase